MSERYAFDVARCFTCRLLRRQISFEGVRLGEKKRMRLTCFLLFVLLAGSVVAQKSKPPVTVTLSEALQKKWVSVRVEALGGHQGERLKVVCQNLLGRVIRVNIPLGQLMVPSDSAQQTLVVSEAVQLAVNTKTPAESLLKTFCTEAGDISPTAGGRFAVGAMAPETMCSLLQFIAEKGKQNTSEAQAAVWCVSNWGRSLGSIGDPELTKFTAELFGKEVPGYRIRHETVTQVPGRPADLGKALVVEGNFRYYLEKDEKTIMVLLDGEGKQLKQISKEELMKAGEHRSSLRLEVYNLDPGKYTVRMQTKSGKVIRDMEVEF
jgi:hypothetical protein